MYKHLRQRGTSKVFRRVKIQCTYKDVLNLSLLTRLKVGLVSEGAGMVWSRAGELGIWDRLRGK